MDTDPHTWLLHHVENIIKQRCLHGNERIDLLQSMIEATDTFPKISSVKLDFILISNLILSFFPF